MKELKKPQGQISDPHPSVAQRKKLNEAREKRLVEALRKNLQKRKEQMRARGQCSSITEREG